MLLNQIKLLDSFHIITSCTPYFQGTASELNLLPTLVHVTTAFSIRAEEHKGIL